MKNDKRKKIKINLYAIIIGVLLLAYSVSIILPLLWGIMSSLKHYVDFTTPGTLLKLPNREIWELAGGNLFTNYLNLGDALKIDVKKTFYVGLSLDREVNNFASVNFAGFIFNTIAYAGGTAFVATMAPCIMGYCCSKFKYKFSNVIYGFVLFVMVMPIVGNTTASIVLMRRLAIYDTIWGMWLKGFTFANTYFLIFFAFFTGCSDTYSEAAQLDGASYLRIMWTIYMPLAIKSITTVFLLQFVHLYNDYNTSLVFIPTHPTLAYAVLHFATGQNGTGGDPPFNLAAAMALAMPMVIFFVAFKKKLMGDVSVGGIKE